jgi:hypothetical protein
MAPYRKFVMLAIFAAVVPALFGCAEIERDKWDSWIGHDWHELQAGGWDSCSPSGGTVVCDGGDLIFTLSGNIITGWNYHPV